MVKADVKLAALCRKRCIALAYEQAPSLINHFAEGAKFHGDAAGPLFFGPV